MNLRHETLLNIFRFDDIEMQTSLVQKSEEILTANDLQLRDYFELHA